MTSGPTRNTVPQAPNRSVPYEDPLRLVPRGLTKLHSLWVTLTYPFAADVHYLSIHTSCHLPRSKAHRIQLGYSVQIRKDAILDVIAPPEQKGRPLIVIDDGTCVGARCLISARHGIHIERDIIIAQSVRIIDHGPSDRYGGQSSTEAGITGGRIRIGEGSWLGHGAAIVCTQGELILGRNCVVAANALVTQSFPSYSVIFGNPGRVVRQFDPAKRKWVMGAIPLTEAHSTAIEPPI